MNRARGRQESHLKALRSQAYPEHFNPKVEALGTLVWPWVSLVDVKYACHNLISIFNVAITVFHCIHMFAPRKGRVHSSLAFPGTGCLKPLFAPTLLTGFHGAWFHWTKFPLGDLSRRFRRSFSFLLGAAWISCQPQGEGEITWGSAKGQGGCDNLKCNESFKEQ